MNFEFSDEQKALGDQLRRFLSDKSSPTALRRILDGPEPFDRELWRNLADMGYLGVVIPEQYGGLGLSYLELCVIAEELGRSLAPTPFSSSVYLATEFLLAAGSEAQRLAWLPRLASGQSIGTFAVAEQAGAVRPGTIRLSAAHGKLTGTKIAVPDGDVADFAVVAARTGEGADDISLFLVDLNAPGVDRMAQDGIDPTRSQARFAFLDVAAEPLGGGGQGLPIMEAVLDRAAILTAFEQVGGGDRALEMARDYALQRMAFGRPIGSFQAIKHMLADMYVSATLARSNAYYGAWALSTDAAELPVAAASARVSATESFQHCSKNNIQIHGGMGFTWAFDCHLYYRRSNLLALNLGSLSSWEERLITRLQTAKAA
jgi:alkylation response protein AidB-like acyl-CoA dehydrogenase